MDPSAEPEAPSDAPVSPGRARGLRSLGPRTLAVCVCVAVIAAILAGLGASWLGSDGSASSTASSSDPAIQLTERIDSRALRSTPLLTIDDEPTTLGQRLSDRPIVVNLWAQSCAPCIKEMPLLERAHQANPDIDFLGVDTQDRLEYAKVMATRTGITYDWVQDRSGDFFFAAQAAGMPTTFIIMPSGEIVASKTGAFASPSELQGWLDDHVA